ncbi:MAG: hypothetical protein J5588_02435 [Bacteroidales bacterium]|nr:hypothetical protein [Bacteroidales bacterium]
MEARITYRSEIIVNGENLAEIKRKFESTNLTSKEGDSDFVELVSVEDNDTFTDLMGEWDNLY